MQPRQFVLKGQDFGLEGRMQEDNLILRHKAQGTMQPRLIAVIYTKGIDDIRDTIGLAKRHKPPLDIDHIEGMWPRLEFKFNTTVGKFNLYPVTINGFDHCLMNLAFMDYIDDGANRWSEFGHWAFPPQILTGAFVPVLAAPLAEGHWLRFLAASEIGKLSLFALVVDLRRLIAFAIMDKFVQFLYG
jgi:hypothetical protein